MSAKFLIVCLVLSGCAARLAPPPPGQTEWTDTQLSAGKMKCLQKQDYPPAGRDPCAIFDKP